MSNDRTDRRPNPQLQFSCEFENPDLVVCRVLGIITRDELAKYSTLESEFGEQACTQNLLLDLSQTTQIDSAGVSWLIRLHRKCEKASGQLIMHSVSPVVCRTFDLLNMQAIFLITENEQTARDLATMNS